MLGFSPVTGSDGPDAYVRAVAEDGTPTGEPILVAGGPYDQACPTVSADGTLVAYQSSESGRDEIYVAHLADPGSRRRVTNDGGGDPPWNRDGSRLFHMSAEGVVSMALSSAAELRFDAPQMVTGSRNPVEISAFDVGPEGSSAFVERVDDPLMLRRDLRLWPAWGATVRSSC